MEKPPREEQEKEKSLERFLRSASESVPSEKHPEKNEDAVVNRLDLGLFAVFDGMGGKADGEKASGLARDCVTRFFEKTLSRDTSAVSVNGWKNILERAMRESSTELGKLAAKYGKKVPDTTATLAKIIEDGGKTYLVYAHAGDSRIYLRRAQREMFGGVKQVTKDDGILEYQWPDLDEATMSGIEDELSEVDSDDNLDKRTPLGVTLRYLFERRNIVFRSLGAIRHEKEIPFQSGAIELDRGDTALLTSDGVHDNLTEREINKIVASSGGAEGLVKALVEEARKRSRDGGHIRAKADDMSAVAVEVVA